MPHPPEPPAVILAAALAEPRQDLRAAALADWLARGGSPEALRAALLAAQADPTAETRRRAVFFLPDLPETAGDRANPVYRALSDPVWVVREAAAVAAGRLLDREGTLLVEPLVALTLRDPHPLVRRAAAGAVGPRTDPARDYGPAVRHPFERQRMRAATALGHVPADRADEAARLLAAVVTDSHAKVRRAALLALARLPAGAIRSLIPVVVGRCAEADPKVAAAARGVWDRFLTDPAGEALRPLQPFAGTADLAGLRAAVAQLPTSHPLRNAWDAIPIPEAPPPTPQRLARFLGQLVAGS